MSDLASFFSTSNLVLDRTDNYCMWLSNRILQCTSLWQQRCSVTNCRKLTLVKFELKICTWNVDVEIGFILYWFFRVPTNEYFSRKEQLLKSDIQIRSKVGNTELFSIYALHPLVNDEGIWGKPPH